MSVKVYKCRLCPEVKAEAAQIEDHLKATHKVEENNLSDVLYSVYTLTEVEAKHQRSMGALEKLGSGAAWAGSGIFHYFKEQHEANVKERRKEKVS